LALVWEVLRILDLPFCLVHRLQAHAPNRPGATVPPQTFSPAPQGLTTPVASILGKMGNKTQVERAPAAKFDHAILYLNKIKTCYPDDQNNTYKQFLEILQTHRKEQHILN
jgi:paired amphipathic helix protein Sin3a